MLLLYYLFVCLVFVCFLGGLVGVFYYYNLFYQSLVTSNVLVVVVHVDGIGTVATRLRYVQFDNFGYRPTCRL